MYEVQAVFTVLPHFVWRYRQMCPEVARDVLLATHGGLSLAWCAVIYHISPMALYRLMCALGSQSLVAVLTRCGLPLPTYFLAMRSTVTVSPTGCIYPRSFVDGSSGIWGIPNTRVRWPLPNRTGSFITRPPSRTQPIESGAS